MPCVINKSQITIITHCRPTYDTVRRSHKTLTETRISKTIKAKQPALSTPGQDDCKTRKDTQ